MMRLNSTGRAAAAVLAVLAMLGMNASDPADATANSTVELGVPGRSNATPWVAGSGQLIAVTWGATAGGKTDVMLAVSRDGGQTFGAPVQVNTIAGEARLGGELPPRVAFAPARASAEPEIVVLWTARGTATAVKIARSRDGGRTFDSPSALQGPAAAGDRGWPALAVDGDGTAHAIWLDHRGLTALRTPGAPRASHSAGAAHDGVAMAQKSALYYAAAGDAPGVGRPLTTGVCYCCRTAVATGPGGEVFAAWRHVYPGNLRDMAFTVSRDGGKTFAPPARVSEDGWSTPRARVPTLGSARPTHPQILIDSHGRTLVAWDESVDGQRVAALRQVTPTAAHGLTAGAVTLLSPGRPAMYPVLAVAGDGVVAVWSTGGETSTVQSRVISLK